MPQRPIIILQRTIGDGTPSFAYVLRADIPALRQMFMAAPGYQSPFKPMAPDVDPDAAGLSSGAVIERAGSIAVSATLTPAEVQGVLLRLQMKFQTETTADKTFARYGTYFNGTAWVAQGA